MRTATTTALLLTLSIPAFAATLTGTFQPDVLAGGTGADLVQGGGGNDRLYGDPVAGVGPPRATVRISTTAAGKQISKPAGDFSFNSSGTLMVFSSSAPEFLPAGEANGKAQVYLKNLATGEVTLVSVGANGEPGDDNSYTPAISSDGDFVAFCTEAKNLPNTGVTGAKFAQLIIKDMNGLYTRVSRTPAGAEAKSFCDHKFSDDGAFIGFTSDDPSIDPMDTNANTDLFILNMANLNQVYRASTLADGAQAMGGSVLTHEWAFSPAGLSVAFVSQATNMLSGVTDKNGDLYDVFLKEIASYNGNAVVGAVSLVSTDENGTQSATNVSLGPAFSPDGREIAFLSTVAELVTPDANGAKADIFIKTVRDGGPRPKGSIRLVSRTTEGAQGDGKVQRAIFSPDGSKLAFITFDPKLVAGIDATVDVVAVKDLAAGDNGAITLVARNAAGGQPNSGSFDPVFVGTGSRLAFRSAATDLVGSDTNGATDIFLVTLAAPTGGADRIDGGTGADWMAGSAGNDTYTLDNTGDRVVEQPGEGIDTVKAGFAVALPANVENALITGTAAVPATGSAAANVLTGNNAANTLKGLAGKDRLNGLGGNDKLYGGAGDDALIGGTGNDTLLGEADKDTLVGDAGNDMLVGGDGADRLTGGAGADRLTGGAGADRFIFTALADSRTSKSARDTITDFAGAAGDRIVLSALDANSRKAGNQAFTWIGSKRFSGKRGQLRFSKGLLSADINGDRRADFAVKVTGKMMSKYVVK